MKKAVFRKLREISEKVLGEEETNNIIEETTRKTVEKLLSDTKPKKSVVENILNGKCDIILNDNITEHL